MSYRAGFLGLIGQPNSGKSTLMNLLVEEKVSIVSSKPQTTRRRVLGLRSNKEGQIVFVDAPGLIKAEKGLNGFLAQEANDVISDCDALLAIVAVDEKRAEDVEKTIELAAKSGKPWIGVITKADLRDKGHRVVILRNLIESKKGKAFAISAKENDADSKTERQELLDACFAILPEAPAPLYDIELFTPETERTLAAEIVREKCFEFLHEEVPFGLATRVLKFEEDADPVARLSIEILIGKENHKAIVIGKGGQMLKQIGSEARKEIEKLLGQQIFLELKVTVREEWEKNARTMKELGYVHTDRKN